VNKLFRKIFVGHEKRIPMVSSSRSAGKSISPGMNIDVDGEKKEDTLQVVLGPIL
jgi:hypothetical protein